MSAEGSAARVLNINVGILGHVDSGKTSLARSLSTVLSTAALDKNPQSQERGITLDLGFSAFTSELPEHLKGKCEYDQLQFTLVDCPGHASLIRTVIGGVQIMDFMILVIDVTKGIQTQTAECLVIAEIATKELIVVLNKLDLVAEEKREVHVTKMKKGLLKVFSATRFKNPKMVLTSAAPGASPERPSQGIEDLVVFMKDAIELPKRSPDGPFVFAIDHCFPIRGQGTVLTGTVLSGSVKLNQTIIFPDLKIEKKVKSMQMFKKPVSMAIQGDRLGICVTQLDAKSLERGLAADPSCVSTISRAIMAVDKIRFYTDRIEDKSKYHITIGHTTVMARLSFFGPEGSTSAADALASKFEGMLMKDMPKPVFDFEKDYIYQEELFPISKDHPPQSQWAVVEFDHPVIVPNDSLFIGSRLESDIHLNKCRLAFYGRLAELLDPAKKDMERVKIYKYKQKEGVVERIQDDTTAVGVKMFKKETDINLFVNMTVRLSTGELGVIEGSFGKSGKFKVNVPAGGLNKHKGGPMPTMVMKFKKYMHDPKKKMVQDK